MGPGSDAAHARAGGSPLPHRLAGAASALKDDPAWQQKDASGAPVLDANGKPQMDYAKSGWVAAVVAAGCALAAAAAVAPLKRRTARHFAAQDGAADRSGASSSSAAAAQG